METKILDVNLEGLEEKLFTLGAKKVFDEVRTVTYFKRESDSGTPYLKLTEEGEKLKLTSQNLETHTEIKFFVSRKEECVRLLATLGYVPCSEVKANRASYELGSIDIDIDEFPGIPAFAEIDMGENPPIAFKELLTALGWMQNKQGHMSTPEIVASYQKDYFKVYKI